MVKTSEKLVMTGLKWRLSAGVRKRPTANLPISKRYAASAGVTSRVSQPHCPRANGLTAGARFESVTGNKLLVKASREGR